MKVGEAFVEVRPDTSKFGPELSKGVESSGKQAASGLSQALTAGIAVAGFSKIIGSASNLQEAMNKTQVTFGEASGSVEQFASTSADSFGISESAALDLAGGLGAMLIPLGTSQEEAASMSTTLLTLAADMGSFNNQDPTEMLERLRSGLAGEAEPLRQFGVSISEARVQQFAWENGLATAGTALTEQQKIMARYGIILQDTSNQQGDFTNTADSAANAERRAAATAEDSAASMGDSFLPVYERAVSVVQTLAAAFGALPGPMQTSLVLLGGFAAFRGPLTAAFGVIGASVEALKFALIAVRGAFLGAQAAGTASATAMLAAAGPWAALAGILVAIHTGLIDVTNAMSETDLDTANVDKMTEAMLDAGDATEGLTLFLSRTSEFDPSFFDALGTNVEDFAEALLGGEDAWDAFVERVTGNLPEGADLDQWNAALELHRSRAQASADAMGEQEGSARRAALGLDENASAAEENAAALDILTESIDAYLDKIQGTEEANAAAAEAQQALFEGLIKNGATFDVNTAKGRENLGFINDWVDTVGGQVTAAADFAAANGNIDVAQRRANNAIQAGVGNLRALRDAGVITQEQFRTYADQLRGIPHDIRTEVSTPGADESRHRADDVREAVNKIPKFGRTEITANNHQAMVEIAEVRAAAEAWSRMTYTAQLQAALGGSVAGAAFGRRAAGGPVSAGRAYLVGEAGPELMVPGMSGTVIPNGGGGPLAGVGGVTVIVEGNVVGDIDRFADEIAYRAAEKIGEKLMPCTLGRAYLPSPNVIRQDGDRLRVGHTGYHFDGNEGQVMAAQVTGYPNVDEPVIRFTYDPESVTGQFDGFYVCVSTSIDWVKLAANLFAWEADLERVPSWQIPLWELVSGGTLRSNAHSIAIGATIPTVGAPVGAFSATPGFETATTRTGEDGAVPVFYDASTPTTYKLTPSWKVAAADSEKGSARLEVSYNGGSTWDVVVGRQVQNLPTFWRLSNSLVRVTATNTAAKTELSIQHHDGTQWDAAQVWQLTQDSSYTALALAPTSLTVFKNAGDEVRIQVGAGTTSSVTLDLRLRRGVRMVEGYLSHPTVTALGIRRATNEAATALSTACGLRATSTADGNKYVVCTPLALAGTDTTIGAIRVSSGTFPFGVGAAVGGTVGTGFGETMGEASGYMAAINHHQNAVAV